MNQEEKQIKHKNLQGYNKKFPKPIIYENYPAPLDMMEIKAEKDKGFWRSFVDYWKNLGKQIKKIFKKDKTEIDLFTGTKVEDVFGEPTNVALLKLKIYILHSKTQPTPRKKNLVLRGPSLKIYEGKIHALIGESGSW